ncbi:MAG: hypothetical protein KDB03_03135 [Planctomycetales bacterium]|nr:hypothetical protein [Planctomycetales bacterium]
MNRNIAIILLIVASNPCPANTVVVANKSIEAAHDTNSEKVELKVPSILKQGGTNWCWAAAGVHALNTYYHNKPIESETERRQQTLLRLIGTQDMFEYFMRKNFSRSQKGTPDMIYRKLQIHFHLADGPKWEWVLDRTKDEQFSLIIHNLRRGRPSCYSYRVGCNYHCVTIVGFEKVRGKVHTVTVVDSITGGLCRKPACEVFRDMAYVFTTIP